jgi:hypothetical protein
MPGWGWLLGLFSPKYLVLWVALCQTSTLTPGWSSRSSRRPYCLYHAKPPTEELLIGLEYRVGQQRPRVSLHLPQDT